jgi:type IV pilus assembly protein PilX
MEMSIPMKNQMAGPAAQQGVSLIVALIMLIVLTLIGVSSMNTAIVELKMAGSSQQQGLALNRADELLRIGEDDVQTIADTPGTFDFATPGDGYYVVADDIDVFNLDWEGSGLTSISGGKFATSGVFMGGDRGDYVVEYIGEKDVIGESGSEGGDQGVAGSKVYTYRITARSEGAKGALRLVQSIYVTANPP